jgi:hypothetical protein
MMDKTLALAIETDLYNELRWLLCAATEWQANQSQCKHLKVYTMDSAFVHARSLYEFFTMDPRSVSHHESKNHNRLTWHDFGLTAPLSSPTYKRLAGPLHGRVIHICKGRSEHKPIKNHVVTLAADILRLWEEFSKSLELKDYASVLDSFREKAIEEAEAVANQYASRKYFAKKLSRVPPRAE